MKTVTLITLQEWNQLVNKTYGKPYDFQQQDGCKERGTHSLTVPCEADESELPEMVPEVVNGEEMGVKFASWLDRDPSQWTANFTGTKEVSITLWWERNFYPDVDVLANDLHDKGLLPAGEYVIEIDW